MRIQKTSQYIEGGTQIASYFTNEVNTGVKWIDGKDIYRKSGSYNYSSTGLVTVETITGIDNIINLYGFLNTGSWQYPANSSNGTSSDFQYLFMNGGTIHFNSVHTGTLLYVIEYTKN